MVATPTPTPENAPDVALMVATAGVPDIQVPPGVASVRLPMASKQMLAEPVNMGGVPLTVKGDVVVHPAADV